MNNRAVFIIGIIVTILVAIIASNNPNISFGVNGLIENRCIEGYKFVLDSNGTPRQILDELGKGVRCYPNPEPGKAGSFGVYQ